MLFVWSIILTGIANVNGIVNLFVLETVKITQSFFMFRNSFSWRCTGIYCDLNIQKCDQTYNRIMIICSNSYWLVEVDSGVGQSRLQTTKIKTQNNHIGYHLFYWWFGSFKRVKPSMDDSVWIHLHNQEKKMYGLVFLVSVLRNWKITH